MLFRPHHLLRSKLLGTVLLLAAGFSTLAEVERLEVTETAPFENGQVFGSVGAYEVLRGTVWFSLDPKDPANLGIVDLDKAPVNEDGRVRFSSDFYVLRPVNSNKANGAMLMDIPNRGNPLGFFFNFAAYLFRTGPTSMAGDGFLFKRGFTLAGVGWQPDTPESRVPGLTLKMNGVTTGPEIKGLVRSDMVFSVEARNLPLSHWRHDPYEVADRNDPRNTLTVRDDPTGPRQVVPRDKWRFGRWEDDKFVDDGAWVSLKEGVFEKGRIYEMIYVAKNSRIVGLGMAAIRDFSTYMKYHQDSPVKVDRTLAFGVSQTGRLIRQFLYQNMNLDVRGRKALDGILATVAGAGRGSFNHRFAQPSRASIPYEMFHQPTDMFPFSCTIQKDPITGAEDGLLKSVNASKATPRLFLMNTGYEYWGRSSSLIHTTPDGKADVEPDPNTRIYSLVSVQHGPASLPPSKVYLDEPNQKIAGLYPLNPANYVWVERALLVALDRWVAQGVEPPPSKYPTLARDQLVRPDAYQFPAIPGLNIAKTPKPAYHIDYGPRFVSEGVVDHQPPKVGRAYGVLVPAVDEDGNEVGGLRLPEIAVPLATHTSWNWRDPETGAGDRLMALAGAFLPFPHTKADRETSGDPRRSIEERYANKTDYVGRFAEASLKLIQEGYLLPEDLADLVEYAGVLWDVVHGKTQSGNPQ